MMYCSLLVYASLNSCLWITLASSWGTLRAWAFRLHSRVLWVIKIVQTSGKSLAQAL